MRRFIMATCGVTGLAIAVATAAWQIAPRAQAQQPVYTDAEEPAAELAQAEEPRIPVDLIALPAQPTERSAEAAELAPLSIREQYVDLLRRKAELMNDGEIAVAIDQLQSDINELEAQRQLEAISGELRALIEHHPGTSAAQRAENMLERAQGGNAPYYGGPTPDRNGPVPATRYEAPGPTPSRPRQ